MKRDDDRPSVEQRMRAAEKTKFKTEQRVMLLYRGFSFPKNFDNEDDVNKKIDKGWRVVSITPMGASSGGESSSHVFAAVVLLERTARDGNEDE